MRRSRNAWRWVLPFLLWAGTASAAEITSSKYAWFNDWCTRNFGLVHEPLVSVLFGTQLAIEPGGTWTYASRSSAVVGFRTSLPATSWVEYGPTSAYGAQTPQPDRSYALHLHYLTNLQAGVTYHYRLVAVDERGRRVETANQTLTTPALANAIRIPEDVSGPPYVLNQAGATYLVTRDLTIAGLAFELKANNITLDLGGHTVVYDNAHMGAIAGDFWAYINNSSIGVKAQQRSGFRVVNGTILQGAGQDAGESSSIGFNPMYLGSCSSYEVAGVTVGYGGPQLIGMYNHWGGGGANIHHNLFVDTGHELVNRHGAGCRAIIFYGSSDTPDCEVHHNLVKRTRQGGLSGGTVHHNEIYIDSYDTNSFGIGLRTGGSAWANRVFGGGYHVCAFSWGTRQTAYRNFIHLKAEALPDQRSGEFGEVASCNAFRLTQYSGSTNPYEDNLYYENVVVIRVKDGRQVRGVQVSSDPYVKNYVWRDGIIKITAEDDSPVLASCLVAQGLSERADQCLPVYYTRNVLITDQRHVCLGDDYGTGSNQHVVDSRLVRLRGAAGYRLVTFDSGTSKNNTIRNPILENGADPEQVTMRSGTHEFALEWTLSLEAAAGTAVRVTDAAGATAFTGAVAGDGTLDVVLSEYRRTPAGKTMLTPHTVTVGGSAKALTMDRRRAYRVNGATWTALTPRTPPTPSTPIVDAGPDRSASTGVPLGLDGTVLGFGAGASVTWRKLSGPGAAVFGNAQAPDTTVTFAQAGAYMLQLVADDGQTWGSETVEITVTGDPAQMPAAPAELSATPVSAWRVALTWADRSDNEDGFRLERRVSGQDWTGALATVAANATSYADTGAQPDTAYRYRVRAFNAAGNSAYGDVAYATTPSVPLVSDLIVDNTAEGAARAGAWAASTYWAGYYGADYLYAGNQAGAWFEWPAAGLTAGVYEVYAWWTACSGRPRDVTYTIVHAGGTAAVANVDQEVNGGQWNLLGTFPFDGAGSVRVLSSANTTEGTCADAVRFRKRAGLSRGFRIRSGADDVEEYATGQVYLDSSDLELTEAEQGEQTVGLRFTGVRVPYGATVRNAAVQFTADEAPHSAAAALTIRGEAADDARPFCSERYDVTARPRTAASVAWTPPAWTAVGAAGAEQRTPDLAAVVQELVNRPGWVSGNALVIMIRGTGKRVAESFEGDPAGAPLLEIDYEPDPSDPDGDGIPDAWELAHFGGTGVALGNAEEDYDGDGYANIAEFIAGTDPKSGASLFAVDIAARGGRLRVGFPTVPAAGTGYAGLTRRYMLQYTDDPDGLADWQGVPGFLAITGLGQTVVYTNTAPGATGRYRARVWLD
ncbi:MAG: hypothetical protein JXR37_05665 [Kiritimatiellae bacterium]|nr:hypothetical protein [Kiritimatiellia bacterium]